jgi:DHA1 family bicyclomycin/chloramphenicol resistance-like MFS transporter
MSSTRLAATLALVFALSPLAIDLYLPTFTAIADTLSVPTQDIALTISIYILGLSLGQFIGGPLSDYRGRRPVLFWGLGVFCVASIVLATTQSIAVFWGARFIQAVGGGFASVVVPAMIRDRTEGQETAKLFALIALITIIAPGIAPAVGTLIYALSGWRAVFFALASYAAVVGLITWRFLHVQPRAQSPAVGSLLTRYRYVLGNPIAMRYLLAQGLGFGVMMTFLANASLVYIESYGVSESTFSILFACNVATLAVLNRVNRVLLNRMASARILTASVALQFLACLALFAMTAFNPPLWLVVPMVMLAVGALGGVMGNSQACMLQFFPHHSGIASALLGSGQYLIAAVVSAISTQFHSQQMWPMTTTMLASALLALLIVPSYGALLRYQQRMGITD